MPNLCTLASTRGGNLAVLHLDEELRNSVHLIQKEKGFRDYFQKKNGQCFNIKEFNLRPNDPAFDSKLDSVLTDPQLKGIFVSTSKGTSVIACRLEQKGKEGVRLIGYDMLEENLRYLRKGTIDFLINQNPKRQAFLSIGHMANYLVFKKPAPEVELFPLEVITQQNVESYLSSGIH